MSRSLPCRLVVACGFLVVPHPLPALALTVQVTPALTRVYGDEPSSFLYQIRAVAVDGMSLAILTDPDPAVHLYGIGDLREWGPSGGGPGELASPVDIEWIDGSIFVLDVGQPKFVRYDERGSFITSRPTENLRARRIWIRGGDTILATFSPMTDSRAAVRLRGQVTDTLFTYVKRGRSIRLEAADAPSFTVKPPYLPQIEWTVLSKGDLVRYDPATGRLEWLDRDGRLLSTTELPWKGIPLTEGDREWWIDSTIPREFMGQRVFEPLRPVARETLRFPERLPRVLAVLSDVGTGVWLRRTTAASGERWMLVSREGHMRGEVVLPPGRELLAAGEAELFALARDQLGVETVEAFHRPTWALP